ncbi:hypothetical protein [Leptolyngbya sp. KIOST-1]|uniref:hypothetical protein n=1 Tax=Leptolyngbya sp. KIOST-1 TaxID=1229172 RepID=UPI0012E04329|nr:hypothetical protein [Leptolyngbya sp. KIOST-1]
MGTIQGFIRRVRLGRRGAAQMVARVAPQIVVLGAIALFTLSLASCAKPVQPTELISEPTPQPNRLTGQMAEVSPPETLESLKQIIDAYTPQVRILSPRPGEVLSDTSATVRLQVRGLPLFKDDTYGLGPHLHLFLDNEPYRAVYDLSEPITFTDLSPGTHTLRVFASRPWHESFKNQGAFDQRTFHVVAPTPQNELNAKAPLLSYSRPQGTYGAEPIMLDFYLTNAPLHMSAQAEANDDLHDWRVRCTVNDQSFVFDQWQPIWLKGFKPGRNWVQLELIDENGNPIDNRFNNTVRIIDYQPGGDDALSQLVRGELSLKQVAGIIDPTYIPPAPPAPEPATTAPAEPEPEPAEPGAVLPEPAPKPDLPEPDALRPEPVPAPELAAPDPDLSPEDTQPDRVLSPEPFPESAPAEGNDLPIEALPDTESAQDDGFPSAGKEVEDDAVPEVVLPEVDAGNRPEEAPAPVTPDTTEDAVENSAEDTTPLAEPMSPLSPQPEVRPEPVLPAPSAPEPLAPSPEPPAKGLMDRFKQWRGQAAPPQPSAPAVPDLLESPDRVQELPSASDGEEPGDTATPYLDEPRSLASPDSAPGPEAASPEVPEAQKPVELPRIDQPQPAPRSPLAPEVRPFI